MKKKNFILRVCLVILLLISPFKTKMMAEPVGSCDLSTLQLFVPDDENCRDFYVCKEVLGVAVFVHGRCPRPLLFDRERMTCDWPNLVVNCLNN